MWPFKRTKLVTKPVPVTYITIPGRLVRVTLCEHKGFSQKDLEKLIEAMCVVSEVINSELFRIYVVATWGQDNYTRIITAKELLDGRGVVSALNDNEIDLSLRYYKTWYSKVIGYFIPGQVWIWLNWKYYSYFSPCEMAGNLAHEWLHSLGHYHDHDDSNKDIAYDIGDSVSLIGRTLLEDAKKLRSKVEVITKSN